MLIISYDIADDKLRTEFSRYLSKFGGRLQYSVFDLSKQCKITRFGYAKNEETDLIII